MPDNKQESKFLIVEQMQVVELEWDSTPMDRNWDIFKGNYEKKFCDLPPNSIYTFEGKHDAYPTGAILYIGNTKAEKGERPCHSAKDRLYGYKPKMSPCYWDMILRLAIIPDESFNYPIPEKQTPASVLERILFHAMKPGLNSREVDSYLPDDLCYRKLLVCNKGDKGLLLPIIYGDYFAKK
jgi:hypothetical protein